MSPQEPDSVVVPLFSEPPPARQSRPLELMPQADDPVRPITKPCARRFNWAAFGVLLFDVFLWLCILALIAWAYDDTATFLKGNPL